MSGAFAVSRPASTAIPVITLSPVKNSAMSQVLVPPPAAASSAAAISGARPAPSVVEIW
ncbi:MAG: hypothetical protein ABWX59_09720 [Microbacteriaceae bacterium]